MPDEVPTIPVRQLSALSVLIDDNEFRLTLAKSSSNSVAEFLDELFENFERKVSRLTSRQFHSVPGVASLDDDSLKYVFNELYRVPYENDATWCGAWVGTVGAIRLEEPTTGPAAKPTARSGASKGSKTTRTPSEVPIKPPGALVQYHASSCPVVVKRRSTALTVAIDKEWYGVAGREDID